MGQYTLSLNSIIKIHGDFTFEGAPIEKKLEVGKQVIFNFDLPISGDYVERFTQLFEDGFILRNLENSINTYDVSLWLYRLKNDIEIKAPLYYKKYEWLQDLLNEAQISLQDGETIETDGNDKRSTITKDVTEGNQATKTTSETDTQTESKEALNHTVDTENNHFAKNSEFPYDISNSDFSAVKYAHDGQITKDDNQTDESNWNERKVNGTDDQTVNSETSAYGTTNGTKEDEGENHVVTKRNRYGNAIDKINDYLSLTNDVINDFIKSFDNHFMKIW